jgi:hypothetical protein
LVPIAIGVLSYRTPRRPLMRAGQRLVVAAGPFLGLVLLLGFFAVTEVVRSWTTYAVTTSQTFSEFVVSRFTTYYYTALNNGAGLLRTSEWPTFQFYSILSWIYRLPFGVGELFWSGPVRSEAPSEGFLRRFGDEEFNNMSGIFPVLHDVGVIYGLIYFGVMGLVFGLLYRASTRGEIVGVMLFPPAFLACLEILRISYLNQPRSFLVVVGALVLLTQFRARSSSRAPAGVPPGAVRSSTSA